MRDLTPRAYDHALVELAHAEAIECVRCRQVFGQQDRVTRCPNASDGTHSPVPFEEF